MSGRQRGPAGSVVIVSGCPGSGKTSLSMALARASPRGFHLVSDHYYEFVAHPILPTLPESRSQNEAIMRALGASSLELARSGYEVFLDGVIGPWMLPQLRPFLASVPSHYVVLQVDEDLARSRVHGRDGAGRSPIVRHMHRQLATLGAFARHGVETAGLDPPGLARTVGGRLGSDALRLDWSRVEGAPGQAGS